LNPAPNLPENAVNAELTDGPASASTCLVPFGVPFVCGDDVCSSKGSKRDFATPAISLNRFDRVGLPGGGGGLRIPLVGGLGLRTAGDAGIVAVGGGGSWEGVEGMTVSLVVGASLV
jgi:hypothetical protein